LKLEGEVRLPYYGLTFSGDLLLKLEGENPGKSVKDRLAYSMIQYLEQEKGIRPGVHTLIEATSGNTGIALAMLCASKG
jgi:cysteine synthase